MDISESIGGRPTSYLERVEPFFNANDVKKVAVFLSIFGSKTYSLLKSLGTQNLVATLKAAKNTYRRLQAIHRRLYGRIAMTYYPL